MMTEQELIERIDAFLKATGMKPTRFGLEVMNEGGLVKSLRDGRSPSLAKANMILDFIEKNMPDEQPAQAVAA